MSKQLFLTKVGYKYYYSTMNVQNYNYSLTFWKYSINYWVKIKTIVQAICYLKLKFNSTV